MKLILVLLFGLTSMFTFAQVKPHKSDYLISYEVKQAVGELYGYKYRNGKIAIKAQFTSIYTDTLYNMAIVLKNWQWVGIDRTGKVILTPYIYDNGPDYVEEGLFRFVENGKIGFADEDGNKKVKARYDFATPFSDGLSEYSIGGEKIYENGQTKVQIIKDKGQNGLADLHWSWGGKIKESGVVNRFGQEFAKKTELKNNRRKVWTKDNKQFILNQKGEIVKH